MIIQYGWFLMVLMICVSLWVSDVSDVSWSPGGQVGLTPRHQLLSGGSIWEGRWSLVIACRSQIGSAYCHTGNAGPLSVKIQNSKHQASKHQSIRQWNLRRSYNLFESLEMEQLWLTPNYNTVTLPIDGYMGLDRPFIGLETKSQCRSVIHDQ